MGKPENELTTAATTDAQNAAPESTETGAADVKKSAKAAKASSGKVKVIANYGVSDDRMTLWGINFERENDQYVAELPEEQAAELIEVGRAIKA